ncbi:MAG: hypothetical protein HND51_05725 [Chloroflexi bacterium]|nr:hypothetical protein [Chloroflexota bacterium]
MPHLAETETATGTPDSQPTETAIAAVAPTSDRESAHLVTENHPDGTSFGPLAQFVKTWTLENTGETVWTARYQVVVFAAPQGETLGAAESISLGKSVSPGESVEISIPLVAPRTGGSYTVVWQLVNERGEVIAVDGGNFWVTIRVSTGEDEAAGTTANGVSVSLTAIDIGVSQTRAEFCFTFPPGDWMPQEISLTAGTNTYNSQGGTLGSYPFSCFYAIFPVGASELASFPSFQIAAQKITTLGIVDDQEAKCEAIKPQLQVQYPGLDFTCLPFEAGQYAGGLVLPSGFTQAEMEAIISDAIQGTLYGPWLLTVTQ